MAHKRRRTGREDELLSSSDESVPKTADILVVHFNDAFNSKARVLRDYACKVCHYIKGELRFNKESGNGNTEVYIVGLAPHVASAFRAYLQFNSEPLMSLPVDDLRHLASYYGLVEIEAKMNRMEEEFESLTCKRICSYCRVVFTDLENEMTSCPRRTLDAFSRLCVRCASSAHFCKCPFIPHKHEEALSIN